MNEPMNTPSQSTGKGILHPLNARVFMTKHRMATMAIAVSFVTVSVLGIATAQGLMNQSSDQSNQNETTHVKHEEGKSVTTTTNSNTDAPGVGPKTNVIVNDQSIPVPNNGSVSRTFTNDDGTTHVEVSNSNNGSSISSSTVTNNSSTSSNTYSQSFNVTTNNSP